MVRHKLLYDLPDHLETERLNLRCFQPGDGAWYYQAALRNRQHLLQFESENALVTIQTEEEAEIIVRRFHNEFIARDYFLFTIFENSTGQFTGQVTAGPLNWLLPEFEIGYIADVNHAGRGYITEAVRALLKFLFHNLQAGRVSLGCNDTNLRSIRVAERCGFTLEGKLRHNRLEQDGSLSTSRLYGMLRSEYLEQNP